MATEEPTAGRTEFGEVSRIRGLAFKYLSFGASIFGILALAVLLIYVTIDAFELTQASPEWLLTYFVALVLPFIGFSTAQMTARLPGGSPRSSAGASS